MTDVARTPSGVDYLSCGVGDSYGQTVTYFYSVAATNTRVSTYNWVTVGY